MSHQNNFDLYIYDNTGAQFTDTDNDGQINVDLSRLDRNASGDLYASVVFDFTSYGSGSGLADLDDYTRVAGSGGGYSFAWDHPDSIFWSDSLTLVSGSYGSGSDSADLGNKL